MDRIRMNKLKLNPDKMEDLCFGGSQVQELSGVPVLDEIVLALKEQVHTSRVFPDLSLSLESCVNSMAWSPWGQFSLAHQLPPFPERYNLAKVVHALITSQFDYSSELYVRYPLR